MSSTLGEFAPVWKGLLSPDFIDGRYFQYTFLTDERFFPAARLFAGADVSVQQANLRAFATLSTASGLQQVTLLGPDRLPAVALAVTWWTLSIEALLAVAFLAPQAWRISALRNYVLLLFCLTTYVVAPVHTFAWTLLTLGIAQTRPREEIARGLLLFTCLVQLVYKFVPIVAGLDRFVNAVAAAAATR